MCEAKEQGAIGQSLCNDNALLFGLQDHVVVVAGLEASHASPPKNTDSRSFDRSSPELHKNQAQAKQPMILLQQHLNLFCTLFDCNCRRFASCSQDSMYILHLLNFSLCNTACWQEQLIASALDLPTNLDRHTLRSTGRHEVNLASSILAFLSHQEIFEVNATAQHSWRVQEPGLCFGGLCLPGGASRAEDLVHLLFCLWLLDGSHLTKPAFKNNMDSVVYTRLLAFTHKVSESILTGMKISIVSYEFQEQLQKKKWNKAVSKHSGRRHAPTYYPEALR